MERLKRWETAALLALCVTLLAATWAQGRSQELSGKLIRLHVLAESDSAEHQSAKLRARDAVLARLTPALEGAESVEEAAARIRSLEDELAGVAAEAAGAACRVSLSREDYPTRHYDDFALPAGEYLSLRLELGEAQGRNWWCVVYPPLCMQSASEARETGAFSEEDVRLVTEDGEGYVLQFRLLELWGRLTGRAGS